MKWSNRDIKLGVISFLIIFMIVNGNDVQINRQRGDFTFL